MLLFSGFRPCLGQLISTTLQIEVCFISPLISKIITGRKGFLFGTPNSREKNHHCSSERGGRGGCWSCLPALAPAQRRKRGVCSDEPSPALLDLCRRGEVVVSQFAKRRQNKGRGTPKKRRKCLLARSLVRRRAHDNPSP